MRSLTDIANGSFARSAGLVLSIAAIGFFAVLVATNLNSVDARLLFSEHWVLVVLTIGIYGLAYVPMTVAWIVLARSSGAEARNSALVRILLISQIGKYLPGNVGQFLGRAWVGQQSGVPLRVSARAMALEMAGVLAACAILAFGALASGLVADGTGNGMVGLLPVILGFAVVTAIVGAVVALSKGENQLDLWDPLLKATSLYIGLFMLLAGSNILLVMNLSGEASLVLGGQVAGAFAVSWLAGFVTPGSPAGLGVREITFYTLLSGNLPQETLLLAALAFRIATVSGDLIAWLVGIVLPKPIVMQPEAKGAVA